MELKECSTEGCNKQYYAKGMCRLHYRRARSNAKRGWEHRDIVCTVEGCERQHNAKGYCNNHYALWRKHGTPTPPRTRTPKGRVCDMTDCNEKHYAKGYCRTHYNGVRTYGQPTKPVKVKPECSIDGCELTSKTRGMCGNHYQKWWYKYNPEGYQRVLASVRAYKRPAGLPVKPLTRQVTYYQMHKRVRWTNGPVETFVCVDCKVRQAQQWAMKNGLTDTVFQVLNNGRILEYSLNAADYEPKCVSCHIKADNAWRKMRRQGDYELVQNAGYSEK
jgi:hypothetical protein